MGDRLKLSAWLEQRRIERVYVVSPHLDDAVYSLATFLSLPDLPDRKVVTLFTEAGSMTSKDFARATGFADAVTEHACRRKEDIRAMTRLNLPFHHCGIQSGCMDDASAQDAAAQIMTDMAGRQCLALLPLGAGGVLHPIHRLILLALRQPTGAPRHGEHLWVRDTMRRRLKGVHLGYYAEIPYQWANSRRDLLRQARALECPEMIAFPVDPDIKLLAAKDYESQTKFILGTRPSYQRRVVSIAERVFLPA